MHASSHFAMASHDRKTVMLNAVNALIEFIQEARAAHLDIANQ